MRLVLREYLSMLKEAGELDDLLPDLLVSMGLDPLNRPARGTRQFGVDLPAVGLDPEDNRRKLFLFVVKQGDITRSNWDTGEQAVRPSLNEIFDIYLPTQVRPEHKDLPKKIILATSGEIKQNVEPNWTGYAREHVGTHAEHGEIQLEFWGADRLALLLEQYLVDEYLFPESAQKQIRKTIALADQNEDEPRQFYSLVEETLFNRNLSTERTPSAKRRRQHALRLLNLSVNIVFHWCQESGNLRPALLCAERTVLRVWDWMRRGQLFDESTQEEFARLYDTYLMVTRSYIAKIRPYCMVRDGLFGHGADEFEYPLRTFEVIGILGEFCMALAYRISCVEEKAAVDGLFQEGAAAAETLAALIQNNPSASTPSFDGHSIDIGLGLLALTVFGSRQQVAAWLEQIGNSILFAYRAGHHFPISSDSYDDLVALQFEEDVIKERLTDISTIVPLLADWFVVLELSDSYSDFQKGVAQIISGTNLQIWFPDEGTEDILYRVNAAYEGGTTLGSILLPERLEALKERMVRLMNRSIFENLSCIKQGWPALGLIASRHFRTPLIPEYWQQSVALVSEPSESEPSGEPKVDSDETTGE